MYMSKLITGQDRRISFDFQHVFQYENHIITLGKVLYIPMGANHAVIIRPH